MTTISKPTSRAKLQTVSADRSTSGKRENRTVQVKGESKRATTTPVQGNLGLIRPNLPSAKPFVGGPRRGGADGRSSRSGRSTGTGRSGIHASGDAHAHSSPSNTDAGNGAEGAGNGGYSKVAMPKIPKGDQPLPEQPTETRQVVRRVPMSQDQRVKRAFNELDQWVKAGTITKEQADDAKAELKSKPVFQTYTFNESKYAKAQDQHLEALKQRDISSLVDKKLIDDAETTRLQGLTQWEVEAWKDFHENKNAPWMTDELRDRLSNLNGGEFRMEFMNAKAKGELGIKVDDAVKNNQLVSSPELAPKAAELLKASDPHQAEFLFNDENFKKGGKLDPVAMESLLAGDQNGFLNRVWALRNSQVQKLRIAAMRDAKRIDDAWYQKLTSSNFDTANAYLNILDYYYDNKISKERAEELLELAAAGDVLVHAKLYGA